MHYRQPRLLAMRSPRRDVALLRLSYYKLRLQLRLQMFLSKHSLSRQVFSLLYFIGNFNFIPLSVFFFQLFYRYFRCNLILSYDLTDIVRNVLMVLPVNSTCFIICSTTV